MMLAHHHRIAVLGMSAAGKSTLAQQLSRDGDWSYIEQDELYWAANWTPRPKAQFVADVTAAVAQERWVCAGVYNSTLPIVLSRATCVVWLNYSLPRLLWRGLKRSARRAWTKEILFAGNTEQWLRLFSKQSILWWIVTQHRTRQRQISALRNQPEYAHIDWIEYKDSRGRFS